MSQTLAGESWPGRAIAGVLPLTSVKQWFHPRPLMRCDGHKPGLSNELFCVPLLTSHTSPSPWHSLGIFCSPCVHGTSSLETGDNANTLAQWHLFMCLCAGSVLAQASVSYRTLCTTLCGFPGAPFGKPSCQLRLGQSLNSFLSHCNNCLDNQHSSASS